MAEEQESSATTSVQSFSDEEEDVQNYSCQSNTRHGKRINRSLIELSEDLKENEDFNEKVYIGGSLEKFSSWECNVPNPKYIIPKRKKSIAPEDVVGGEEQDKIEHDPFIHCYEIEFVECPSWKMGIEPLTYRYIVNHGRYRAYKLAQRLFNSNSRLRSNGKVNYDRHKLRNAIQIELKKEFEVFVQHEKQKYSIIRQQELAEQRRKNKFRTATEEKSKNEVKQLQKSDEYKVLRESQIKCMEDAKIEDSTPRSNLSLLSSQTPLPPINVPLISNEENNNTESKELEDSINVNNSGQLGKPQKLWHIPSHVPVSKESDVIHRHRSAPKQLENSSYSEPNSRVSSRNSGHNKTISSVKESNLYRLKKLPTITDFHDNIDNDTSHIEKDTLTVRRMSQPVNSGLYNRDFSKARADDTISVVSEPRFATTPVLQGTAYDISKLRSGASEMFNVNPEIVSLLDNVRSSQNMDTNEQFHTSQEKTPLEYIAAKYKNQKDTRDEIGESLQDIISTKQYVNSKSRTGLNPYLRKPKVQIASQPVTMDGLEGGIGDAFRTLPITSKPHGRLNGDVMPDMLVRRAEIAVTNKRVI